MWESLTRQTTIKKLFVKQMQRCSGVAAKSGVLGKTFCVFLFSLKKKSSSRRIDFIWNLLLHCYIATPYFIFIRKIYKIDPFKDIFVNNIAKQEQLDEYNNKEFQEKTYRSLPKIKTVRIFRKTASYFLLSKLRLG